MPKQILYVILAKTNIVQKLECFDYVNKQGGVITSVHQLTTYREYVCETEKDKELVIHFMRRNNIEYIKKTITDDFHPGDHFTEADLI